MSSAFEAYNYDEIFNRVPFPARPEKVLRAWGEENDGWSGGIVVLLSDGRHAYFTGWCDYTGWG